MNSQTVLNISNELELLTGEIAGMGGLVEDMLSDALAAVVTYDAELALEVVDRDGQLDELKSKIEHTIFDLIERRELKGQDLRQALAGMKVAVELRRIGNLSRSIAKRTSHLKDYERSDQAKSLDRMGRLVSSQLKRVLDAYGEQDYETALDVRERDEEVDEFYNSIFRIMVTYMIEDGRKISACAHFMFMAKKLERAGDHCSQIAEIIHYAATGEYPATERPVVDDV
ncbi:phosphate signaling complex protein PhoU [Hirschia maritima]|uniref:phosphate signaling complex protein PhoU n=1 Tax=Hirschia maritima TaxID=1121961 RepID=UPI00036B11D9|nr:phosphate signaling complex protein PhoU [Hirschia maritima]